MYYFEYDKKGFLYKYKEYYGKDKCYENKLLCYCIINKNKLFKIEENGEFKNYVNYDEDVTLKHRFDSGESFISVVNKNSSNIYAFNYANIRSQISLEKNKVYNYKFQFKKTLINKWINLIN